MISLIIFLLTLGVVGFLFIKKRGEIFTPQGFKIKPVFPLILIFVVGLLLSMFQPYKMERIDAGNTGVRVNLTGGKRGASDVQAATGWVIYNSWTEEIHEYPTYIQHIKYEETPVILKGGFGTTMTPTFNYKLKQTMVHSMFRELRLPLKEIEQGWLNTAIMSSVNDVSNRWEVDQIFVNREKFENEIIAECNKRVGEWFIVSDLRTHILPPPALQKAIEAKTRAIQEAQAKEQETLVAIAEGLRILAVAQADSAERVTLASGKASALIIRSEAEAKAIQIKTQEIDQKYIDYLKAQGWDGKLPTYQGNGAGFFFDARK